MTASVISLGKRWTVAASESNADAKEFRNQNSVMWKQKTSELTEGNSV